MKLNRFTNLLVCLMAFACHNQALEEGVEAQTPSHHTRSLLFFPIFPPLKPFSIFSKPRPDKEDEQSLPKKPDGLVSHVGHVLQGGSIGIEIRPLAPFQGILDHAKKILPGGHGTVGRPNHERPEHPSNYEGPHQQRPGQERPHKPEPGYERPQHPGYERPHQQRPGDERPQHPGYERPQHPGYERPHQQRPGDERPQHPGYERPQHPGYERPHQQRPGSVGPHKQEPGPHELPPNIERPNKDRPDHEIVDEERPSKPQEPPKKEDYDKYPAWEDIGEDAEDYGDGVLQPRGRRPKRFVESKIYHVPLLYRSNGRTHRVRRIKGRNELAEDKLKNA